MGRRKIEIQPITHERNRSVTFLKRKNGLFKKAYELGVLCSVDVAVIIFEERPGHEVKFHSYSSCDLRDIVQRQIRFQGDRDSRGPADFSGGAGGKYDEDGDDNDDEDDDESNRRTSKRKISKLGMQSDMGVSDVPDYLPPVPRNGLPHLAMGGGGSTQGHYDDASTTSIGSLMPVSNDRVSSLRSSTRGSKRQRTNDSGLSRSNSPSLDHDRSYMLPNSSHLAGNTGGRMSTRDMRHSTHVHAHDESGPTGMMLQHGPQHLYAPNAPGYGSPQQYGHIFPLGGPGGPMNMGPPPGPIPPLPPRFEPQYDPALYQHQYGPPNIIRQASVPGQGSRNDGGNISEHRDGQPLNGPQRERGGGEMFAAFLEADERSRQMAAAAAAQRQHQDQLNWPSTTSPSTPSTPPTIHTNQPGTSGNAPTAPPNTGNWFDLFSGSGPAPNPAPEGANIPWSRINNVDNISAHIAQILNSDSAPPAEQPGGPVVSTPAAAGDHPSGSSSVSNAGNGDSVNTKAKTTVVPVAQSREEIADETEPEQDAEGEDEDIDGAGDKKGDNMAAGVAMAVDPPPSFTKNDAKEADLKENQGDGVEQGDGDGDDSTVMAKIKPARGRPKKAATSSRGRGKAKG